MVRGAKREVALVNKGPEHRRGQKVHEFPVFWMMMTSKRPGPRCETNAASRMSGEAFQALIVVVTVSAARTDDEIAAKTSSRGAIRMFCHVARNKRKG